MRLNVLSSNPEPRITLDFIAFNPKMDRAWSSAGSTWPPLPASPGDSSSTRKARMVLRSTQEAGRRG